MTHNYASPYSFHDWRTLQVKPVYIHQINASSQILWEVLSDVEKYGEILPQPSIVEVLTGSPQNFRAGIRYKHTVQIEQLVKIGFNLNITIFNTIVEVNQDDACSGSAKIACSLRDDLPDSSIIWGWEINDTASDDEENSSSSSSNLIITVSIIAGGICNMIYFLLFGCYMHRIAMKKSCEVAKAVERIALQRMKERESIDEGELSNSVENESIATSKIENTVNSRHSRSDDESEQSRTTDSEVGSQIVMSEKNKQEEQRMRELLVCSMTRNDDS